uniref:BZIP domain-containing protein n=1 Tax=Kalanchoe fedtschenkoi TaxID=63787 RepID=A0A7N1A4N9_KALFE
MSDAGIFDDGVDLEHVLGSDPELVNLLEDSVSSPAAEESTDSVPSWIGEIENLLMNDDLAVDAQLVDGVDPSYLDQFIASFLLDAPADVAGDGELMSASDDKSPRPHVSDFKGASEKETEATQADANGDADADNDPNFKKRKRQLRNKDAALRSRERKKMYVKDLEVKSRYLEGECRRLGRLLQCCNVENQDLRFRLHMGNGATGAVMTKQESAVLLLESLLLGSLFWFLGIVCLFHPPKLLDSNKEAVALPGIGKSDPRSACLRRVGSNIIQSLGLGTLVDSRTCRALRTKMKPLHSYTSSLSILA